MKVTWSSREVAKFGCGFEAFHSIAHWYLFAANINLTILGFGQTPTWNAMQAVAHTGIGAMLGLYAWRSRP